MASFPHGLPRPLASLTDHRPPAMDRVMGCGGPRLAAFVLARPMPECASALWVESGAVFGIPASRIDPFWRGHRCRQWVASGH
jgi:hypothetical protein